jgi:hypothetical protein
LEERRRIKGVRVRSVRGKDRRGGEGEREGAYVTTVREESTSSCK